ncbi:uncharacterized protein LOC580673 [Strongylocentrotus purpuratus]|uniref:Cadherin-like beta-sandwich-like domain-containing protein n=1 Tax=Strongylocentrotus purpuratus TaxID=7668 RepID=A0A7M7PPW8_STRPU|nr:uncharacterized protein LOC580673 [Strongylocentrotus purpuratus]
MDDADLEKLSIKPGSLNPKFNRNTTEYNVTVASDVGKLTISCLTSDSNASYQIVGGDGGRTVDLAEGKTTTIKIDVSAEDGTSKLYIIHAKRLSATDASLSGIKIADGCLVPDFDPDTLNYSCLLPYTASALKVTPTAPDKKNAVKVNGQDPGSEVNLNVGDTAVEIEVTSADGSNKQTYTVNATKKWLGRAVQFADCKDAMKYECPITTSPFYKPCSIKGSEPKHVFSEPIINELTRTSKVDPLDGTPLENEWKVPEGGIEKELSGATVCCLYSYTGCEEKMKYSALGAHIKMCDKRPKIDADPENTDTCKECSRKLYKEEMEWHKSNMCTSKHTSRELKHAIKSHDWEKKLQGSEQSGSVDQLMSKAKELIKKYRSALPKKGQSSRFDEGGSPLDLLHTAAVNLACAIKQKPKQADLHFTLGLVLEETYHAQDMYGLKKDDDDLDDSMAILSLGLSTKSKDSSKEDDIQAICQQRGAGANAPLARQLQAIDEEFKHLLNSGQSQKSDYVQELYLFKSKQATQGGKTSQAASDESNPLGQACLKFMDSLSLEQNSVMYNIHVGRLLLLQDKVEDALTRLQHAVGLKPFLPIARFYLGLALVQQKSGPGARTKEAMTYLNDGVQYLLELTSKQAETVEDSCPCDLHSEDLWRSSSGQLLKGCIELGKLLKITPTSGFLTAADVFHSAAILAGQNLCTLPSRGDTYQSMEWVLLDVHAILLEMLMEKDAGNAPWIAQRCQRLSSLVSCSTIPQSQQVLKLQEQTCQKGVIAQPCNSQALCHLGNSQLAMHENDPTSDLGKKALLDAMLSFRASMENEGKPSIGGDLPAQITEQGWWQEKKKKEEAAATSKTAADKGKGVAPKAAPARGAAAGRGTPTSRGTTRGAPATARGGAAKAAPATRGGAARGRGTTSGASKGAPARGRGGGTTTKPPAGAKSGQPSKTAPAKAVTTPSPEPSKEAAAKPASTKTTPVPANAPLNRMSYLPRLGLARALAKETEDTKESRMLYDDVITMAPKVSLWIYINTDLIFLFLFLHAACFCRRLGLQLGICLGEGRGAGERTVKVNIFAVHSFSRITR